MKNASSKMSEDQIARHRDLLLQELSVLRQALEFSYSLSPEGREALRKIDAAIRGDHDGYYGKDKCQPFHRWNRTNTGFVIYEECKDCGYRIAHQPHGPEYQPVDHEWLRDGKK